MKNNIFKFEDLCFILLTFIFSWTAWLILIGSGISSASQDNPMLLLWYLGQLGPGLSAVICSILFRKKLGLKFFNKKSKGLEVGSKSAMSSFKLVLVSISFPLFWLIPSIVYSIFISKSEFIISPVLLTMNLIPAFIFSFTEELGWRGFLFRNISTRLSIYKGSIIIGLIWAIWHLPILYFSSFKDPNQFIFFLSTYIPTLVLWSIIFGWLFKASNQSILAVTISHTLFTVSYNLMMPFISVSVISASILPMTTTLIIVMYIISKKNPSLLK